MSKKVKIPLDKNMELKRYGYNLEQTTDKRRTALRKAAKHENPLAILKRLVVLRTYRKNMHRQPYLNDYKILDNDVKYMQAMYRTKYSKTKKSSRKGSRKASRKGSRK